MSDCEPYPVVGMVMRLIISLFYFLGGLIVLSDDVSDWWKGRIGTIGHVIRVLGLAILEGILISLIVMTIRKLVWG